MAAYNYRAMKNMNKAKKVHKIPKEGTWIPVAAAAHQSIWSGQMLRYLHFRGLIDGIKVANGVLLLNFDQIQKLKKQSDHKTQE